MRSTRKSVRRRQTVLMEAVETRTHLNAAAFPLASAQFTQNWSNPNLITANDNWDNVPSIIGYLGDTNAGTTTNVDPRTYVSSSSGAVDVIANQADVSIFNGGVAEFDGIPDRVVALQGSGTADTPALVIHLNTTGVTNIPVDFDVRDIDSTAENTNQQVAVQYRVGNTGDWTNLTGTNTYIADASEGPSLATLVTHVSAILPSDAENKPLVQIRVLTTNAPSNDEWVGIDNIVIGNDVPGNAQFGFSDSNYQASENVGTLNVTITRGGDLTNTVSVDLTTSNITALAGSDYTAITSQTVTFLPNELSKDVPITILDGAPEESFESFLVTLSNPVNGFIVADTATVSIVDDDSTGAPTGLFLNEISVDPATDTDAPFEYVEVRGPTVGAKLFNVYVVQLEGDAPTTPSAVGVSDKLVGIGNNTLGTNGLMMIKGTAGGFTAEEVATSVVTSTQFDSGVGNAIENESQTWLLIYSQTPLGQGVDYDVNNDGTLEALPVGAVVLDSVGWTDGGSATVEGNPVNDTVYGPAITLAGSATDVPDAVTRFLGDNTANNAASWYGGFLAGTNSSKAYTTDPTFLTANFPTGGRITPGGANNLLTAGTLGFTVVGYTVNEAAGTATVTVARTGLTSGAVAVSYATTATGSTATAGSDYTATSGTLNWANNESGTKSFTVTIANDSTSENAETINLTLTNPTNGSALGQATATLTIIDNDSSAPAGTVLSEIKSDPAGLDSPFEYVEIRGVPGTTLNNVYVVGLEGDGGTAATGVANFLQNLSGFTIGTNGLLIVKAATGGHTPGAGTTIVPNTVMNNASALQNGAQTFLLVFSPTPLVASADYDTDPAGDGLPDFPSDTQVVDSVGWKSAGLGVVYSTATIDVAGGNSTIGGATRFYGYDNPNDPIGWYGGVLTGANSDVTYSASDALRTANFPTNGALTPGVRNAPIMADANEDGIVDTQDFNVVAGNFGTGTTFATGNFDGTGTVDSVDFGLLLGQYGKRLPSPGPVAAVASSPFGATLVEGEGLFTEILA